MADEDLALLDWVVASVHNAPDSRPTERVLEAMQNPYVDVHRPPHRAGGSGSVRRAMSTSSA